MVTFDEIKQNANVFFHLPMAVSNNDVHFISLLACEGDYRSVGVSCILQVENKRKRVATNYRILTLCPSKAISSAQVSFRKLF